MFNYIRNCWTVFQSGCMILHSHQQYMRVLFALRPGQHLVLSPSFLPSPFRQCNRCVVASYSGFTLHFPKWLMMWSNLCLFASCIFCLVKNLFEYFAHFLLDSLFSYCWILRILYILWIYDLCQIHDLNIFNSVCILSFHSLKHVFCRTSFSCDEIPFNKFFLMDCIFSVRWKNKTQVMKNFFSWFLLRIIVSCFTFRSVTPFELIFR